MYGQSPVRCSNFATILQGEIMAGSCGCVDDYARCNVM